MKMKTRLPEKNRFSLNAKTFLSAVEKLTSAVEKLLPGERKLQSDAQMFPSVAGTLPSGKSRRPLGKTVSRLSAGMAAMAVMAVSSVSCTLETSDNGDLDGYWHLERVDTLATGGVCDLSEELRFWGIQRHLINIVDRGSSSNANGGYFGYLSHFSHEGDRLRLYDMYVNDRMVGDIGMESADELNVFGINSLDENFRVEHLSSSEMRLSTDVLRLHFKKM